MDAPIPSAIQVLTREDPEHIRAEPDLLDYPYFCRAA